MAWPAPRQPEQTVDSHTLLANMSQGLAIDIVNTTWPKILLNLGYGIHGIEPTPAWPAGLWPRAPLQARSCVRRTRCTPFFLARTGRSSGGPWPAASPARRGAGRGGSGRRRGAARGHRRACRARRACNAHMRPRPPRGPCGPQPSAWGASGRVCSCAPGGARRMWTGAPISCPGHSSRGGRRCPVCRRPRSPDSAIWRARPQSRRLG